MGFPCSADGRRDEKRSKCGTGACAEQRGIPGVQKDDGAISLSGVSTYGGAVCQILHSFGWMRGGSDLLGLGLLEVEASSK
jgi:hypothetical protein